MPRFSDPNKNTKYKNTAPGAPAAGVVSQQQPLHFHVPGRPATPPAPASPPLHPPSGTHAQMLHLAAASKSIAPPRIVVKSGVDEHGPWEITRPVDGGFYDSPPQHIPATPAPAPPAPPSHAPAPAQLQVPENAQDRAGSMAFFVERLSGLAENEIVELAMMGKDALTVLQALTARRNEAATLKEELEVTTQQVGVGAAVMVERKDELLALKEELTELREYLTGLRDNIAEELERGQELKEELEQATSDADDALKELRAEVGDTPEEESDTPEEESEPKPKPKKKPKSKSKKK